MIASDKDIVRYQMSSDSDNRLLSIITNTTKPSDFSHNKEEYDNNNNNKESAIKWINNGTTETSVNSQEDLCLANDKLMKTLKDNGYNSLAEIGRGSHGNVYTVQSDKHDKQVVAIKVVDLCRLTQQYRHQFLKVELDLLRALSDHRNVCKIYEIIDLTDCNLICEVMDYYPNGDLFEYIQTHHNIPEGLSCRWYKQIIDGLEHIHRNGLAHRDIKCENLLLNNRFDIKIIDFGFCCRLEYNNNNTGFNVDKNLMTNVTHEECLSETFVGSVIYASPEILRQQPYLPTKADIWSSGIVLYVMLFGFFPNDGQELEKFYKNNDHFIDIPSAPQVSIECQELLNNILVNENNRFSIDKIKASNWFKKIWLDIDNITHDIQQYFRNLNISRQETEEFTTNED